MPASFGTFTLKKRFLLVCIMVTGMVLLLTLAGWRGFTVIQQKTEIVLGVERAAIHLQNLMRGLSELALTEGTPAAERMTREAMEDFEETYARLLPKVQSVQIKRELRDEIHPRWLQLKKNALAFLADGDISLYNTEAMIRYGQLSAEADRLLAVLQGTAELERDFADAVISRILAQIGILAAAIITLTSLIMAVIYRTVAHPLAKIARRARQAAEGDLSFEFETDRRDEIGILTEAFREMTLNLRQTVSRARSMAGDLSMAAGLVKTTGTQTLQAVEAQNRAVENTVAAMREIDDAIKTITRGSEDLSGSSEKTTRAVSKITESIQEITRDANVYRDATEETASWIEQMVKSVDSVGQNIEALSAVSQETSGALTDVESAIRTVQQKVDDSTRTAEQVSSDASEKGLVAIGAVVEGMTEIRTSVSSLTEVLHGLGKRSQEIGRIISVIDEIADQTQLLSLNAAILAAQAGERGSPFAVVAEEIKSLAHRTTDATGEISDLVLAVQNETRSSIDLVHNGTETVEKGMDLVEQASSVFENISTRSQTNAQMSREMRGLIHEQAKRIQQGAQSTRRMAEHIEQIVHATREQSSGTSKILNALNHTREIFVNITAANDQQSTSSQVILQSTCLVSEQAAQINSNIQTQQEKTANILRDMENIRSSHRKITSSAVTMNDTLAKLKKDTEALDDDMRRYIV